MKYALVENRILMEESGDVDDIGFNYCVADIRERPIVSGFYDIDKWCKEIVSPPFVSWKRRYSNYWFLTEKDAMMFILKWA